MKVPQKETAEKQLKRTCCAINFICNLHKYGVIGKFLKVCLRMNVIEPKKSGDATFGL